ncbi:MAG: C45 family peptidase [Gemmataceae bacterium]
MIAPSRLFALVVVFVLTPTLVATEPFRYPEAKHGKAELRYIDHIPVLVVQGSPEQIGEQEGALALKPASDLVKMVDVFVKKWGWERTYPALLKMGAFMGPRFPPEHMAEIEAAAKASGWPRDLLVFANSLSDLSRIARCSAILIEPGRSATGGMLFGRNLDWPPAGTLHEYPLLIVYKPAGKRAFASITYPGMVGVFSGINDAGLALADLTVTSSKDGALPLNPTGMPYTLALRRVLEECATVEEAEKLLRSFKRTVMHNVAICDPKHAAVFEITSRSLVVRPGLEGICCCTNHFRCDALATGKKCDRYDALEKSRDLKKVTLGDVAKRLDAANQGPMTLQTMIFEPAELRLHIALGAGPATRLPLRTVELKKLLAK